uniref:Uncharacterized protein n=1 Tax=Anguilla anguilla TaxID=7936 RepID=A0A0E9XMX8_ANGAN
MSFYLHFLHFPIITGRCLSLKANIDRKQKILGRERLMVLNTLHSQLPF